MVQACHSSTGEVEAGGPWTQDWPRLHGKTHSYKTKTRGCRTGLVRGVFAMQSQEPESKSHKRTQEWQNTFVISVLGSWGQEGIGSSLAGQPSWIGGLQVQWESLSQKKTIRMESNWGVLLTLTSDLCMHTYMHTHIHKHVHAYTRPTHIHTHAHISMYTHIYHIHIYTTHMQT